MSYDLHDDQNEQSEQEHFMKEHDMVFSKSENGDIMAGGFTVGSMLLKNITQYGASPIENLEPMIGGSKNTNQSNQTNQTKNINDMAVPFGLFYKQEKNIHKNFNNSYVADVDNNNEISDEIYDELLKKVNANDDSYEKSKKSGKSEKKKSRKNKNKLTKSVANHKKTSKSSPV
jgi:hypothetical protein